MRPATAWGRGRRLGMHSGPCSLIRFYASMHMGAAVQNFFKVENALGAFRGNQEKMAQGPEPLGLELNEEWLRRTSRKENRGGGKSGVTL